MRLTKDAYLCFAFLFSFIYAIQYIIIIAKCVGFFFSILL